METLVWKLKNSNVSRRNHQLYSRCSKQTSKHGKRMVNAWYFATSVAIGLKFEAPPRLAGLGPADRRGLRTRIHSRVGFLPGWNGTRATCLLTEVLCSVFACTRHVLTSYRRKGHDWNYVGYEYASQNIEMYKYTCMCVVFSSHCSQSSVFTFMLSFVWHIRQTIPRCIYVFVSPLFSLYFMSSPKPPFPTMIFCKHTPIGVCGMGQIAPQWFTWWWMPITWGVGHGWRG
jgi:hypothetical protein